MSSGGRPWEDYRSVSQWVDLFFLSVAEGDFAGVPLAPSVFVDELDAGVLSPLPLEM